MEEKPAVALGTELRYGPAVTGRARADDFLRRKLIRKMRARREQRTPNTIAFLRRLLP